MTGAVINNSTSTIQIHMQRVNKPDPIKSDLANYKTGQTAIVGRGSSADIGIENAGKYIYVAVWSESASTGSPSSYVVFDTADGAILNSSIGGYTISIRGSINNWVITVGNSWTRTILITVGLIVGLLFLLLILGLIYFYFMKAEKESNNDLPFIIL